MLFCAHLLHSPLLEDLLPLFSTHTAEDSDDDPELLFHMPHSKVVGTNYSLVPSPKFPGTETEWFTVDQQSTSYGQGSRVTE